MQNYYQAKLLSEVKAITLFCKRFSCGILSYQIIGVQPAILTCERTPRSPAFYSMKNYCYLIETFKQEELLNMIEENPTLFIKCTFRVDTSGRQRKYYGQLPTPDSVDIQILGRVRGVYEDDIVVLELEQSTLVNEEGKEEKIIIPGCGHIKGKHNFI